MSYVPLKRHGVISKTIVLFAVTHERIWKLTHSYLNCTLKYNTKPTFLALVMASQSNKLLSPLLRTFSPNSAVLWYTMGNSAVIHQCHEPLRPSRGGYCSLPRLGDVKVVTAERPTGVLTTLSRHINRGRKHKSAKYMEHLLSVPLGQPGQAILLLIHQTARRLISKYRNSKDHYCVRKTQRWTYPVPAYNPPFSLFHIKNIKRRGSHIF
jgi:hypothetical protein